MVRLFTTHYSLCGMPFGTGWLLVRRLVRSLDDISLVNPDILHLLRGRGGGSWWAGSEGTGDCLWGIVDPPEGGRLVG